MSSILPRQTNDDIILHEESFSEDDCKRIIRKMNLKVTHQRVVILTAMHTGRKHVTAQELFEIVNKTNPEIGFATVYRFLRELADHGFVTELRMGGLPARYELAPQAHHDHLTCVKCGAICEFENKAIEKLQLQVAEHFGFVLTGHILELYGVCPTCQSKKQMTS